MTETIYFDTCALNRLNDDLTQLRVRRESEAVAQILDWVIDGKIRWIASTVLQAEVARNPDPIRRVDTLRLLSSAVQIITPTLSTRSQAAVFVAKGLGDDDALHLAVAQQSGVQYLITTDDRFLNAARRLTPGKLPEVINPVNWLQRRHPWLLPRP